MVHQPVSRGLAVFVDAWLSGNGSALEVVLRDNALYKSTTLLLLFNRHITLTNENFFKKDIQCARFSRDN